MRFEVRDLGRLPYSEAWDIQREAVEQVQAGGASQLLLVEHEPVLTLGAGFHEENLTLSRDAYLERGIEIVRTDRGGDVTYHGPGQLVIYPIFDLNEGRDLHQWLRQLEETMLVTLRSFGIEGRRFPPHTGAWVGNHKIAAIGIKVKRWVSLHGIALNCGPDLSAFDLFVPCGIREYGVTSLSVELQRTVTLEEAKPRAVDAFRQVIG